ncbi:anti-sigma regulatory factor (Ser/Thr protein kinase) [Streptomyces sp. LBL]|uniref:ATP-binding protein n=1 Tax=Streptomyces sp. LBL TaxID=2940562 RepID=UPI0024758C21|nr:ATP-binding protein [Streptomyces sp. LBL]MDH6627682.1 anti-sigma regulatory factor (Ser/Thr protein kinase) [Streptomyces sp. LBL]
MSEQADRVRLLPWTGAHGQPCLLLTGGDGSASRLADRIESVQLGLAHRLLGRTRDLLAAGGLGDRELGLLADQLADALSDTLRIATSRGSRLGGWQRAPEGGTAGGVVGETTGGATDGPLPAMDVLRHVWGCRPAGLRAHSLLALPGRDLSSARAARRHVRDTARSWGLSRSSVDDLESISGELVANALEHSDSRTITVTCALTADRIVIGVTDEGAGRRPYADRPGTPCPPGPESEHGRGLLITDVLAARWGAQPSGSGLTVWAEVLADAPGDAVR